MCADSSPPNEAGNENLGETSRDEGGFLVVTTADVVPEDSSDADSDFSDEDLSQDFETVADSATSELSAGEPSFVGAQTVATLHRPDESNINREDGQEPEIFEPPPLLLLPPYKKIWQRGLSDVLSPMPPSTTSLEF